MRVLLQNQADIYARQTKAWTPLHIVTQKGHVDVVNMLLQNHADLNAKLIIGATPLNIATQKEQVDVVNVLLTKQVALNVRNGMARRRFTLQLKRAMQM